MTSLSSLLLTLLPFLPPAYCTPSIPATPSPLPSWSHAPTHFSILIYPGFQPSDISGPLDVLGPLSMNQPIKLSVISRSSDVVYTIFPKNMTEISMEEVLRRQGGEEDGDEVEEIELSKVKRTYP